MDSLLLSLSLGTFGSMLIRRPLTERVKYHKRGKRGKKKKKKEVKRGKKSVHAQSSAVFYLAGHIQRKLCNRMSELLLLTDSRVDTCINRK